MTNKIYYRFQELLHHQNLTSDELLYQVENHQLKLSFILENQKLLVGRYEQDKYEAYGIGRYTGPVSVDRATSIRLFTTGKAKCSDVFVRMNRFSDYSNHYPFEVSLPDSVINSWLPTNPSDFGTGAVIGKLNPRQGPSGAAAAREVLSALSQFAQNNSSKIPSITELNSLKDKAIYTDDFKFSIEQACILSADLKRVGLLGQNSASKPHSSWPSTVSPSEAPNPNRLTDKPNRLEQRNIPQFQYPNSRSARLAERLIGYAPDEKSDALWSIVRKAMRDDELLDLIDPEREVLEITPDTLFWNVPDTAPTKDRKLSRTSFKNTVSKVKKKLS